MVLNEYYKKLLAVKEVLEIMKNKPGDRELINKIDHERLEHLDGDYLVNNYALTDYNITHVFDDYVAASIRYDRNWEHILIFKFDGKYFVPSYEKSGDLNYINIWYVEFQNVKSGCW